MNFHQIFNSKITFFVSLALGSEAIGWTGLKTSSAGLFSLSAQLNNTSGGNKEGSATRFKSLSLK